MNTTNYDEDIAENELEEGEGEEYYESL